MPKFNHHPDGRVHIDDVTIPLGEFLKDEPDYQLPDGAIGMRYDGEKALYFSASKEWRVAGADKVLDGYIQKKDKYIKAIGVRNQTIEPTEKEFLDDLYLSDKSNMDFLFELNNRLLAQEEEESLTVDQFQKVFYKESLANRKEKIKTRKPEPPV